MPIKPLCGTFEGKPHYRWVKYYKGERYRVKCWELGLAEHRGIDIAPDKSPCVTLIPSQYATACQ